jgi:hypothetical protein
MRSPSRHRLLCALASLFACSILVGCSDALPAMGEEVTYHHDMVPLLARYCTGCHVEGGIAPFALTDYRSAVRYAEPMRRAVLAGTMPPSPGPETSGLVAMKRAPAATNRIAWVIRSKL